MFGSLSGETFGAKEEMETKTVALIQGHPNADSYNQALYDAYKKGLLASGHKVHDLILRDMDFELNLRYGYQKRTELEPDLLAAQETLKAADHIVIFFPVWWGGVPALLKGFFDRILLPGYAFKKREGSLWWDRMFKNKTGRIISTLDQPAWYYRFNYFRPSHNAVNRMTLRFIGVKPARTTAIGPIRNSSDKFRQKWLEKVEQMGRKAR